MKNVRYSSVYNDIIDQFVSSRGDKHFKTIREFLVFAANLGYSIDDKRSPSLPLDLILDSRNQMDNLTIDAIYSIGLADKKNKEILSSSNNDELASIFEAYIEGGLNCINKYCIKYPSETSNRNSTVITILIEHNLISFENSVVQIEDVSFR